MLRVSILTGAYPKPPSVWMIEPLPVIKGLLVIVRSGLINPSVLSALKLPTLRSMLPPNRKLLPWSNRVPLLTAWSEAPNVVAWFAVRSTVPYGVALQVLPLPGGQGIGLLFVSRMAKLSWNAVVTGFGGGKGSSCRHR